MSSWIKRGVVFFLIVTVCAPACGEDPWTDPQGQGSYALGDTRSPPEVRLLAPAGDATVCGLITIVAEATDDDGVVGVDFFLDDQKVHTDTQAPYLYEWDTDSEADGDHVVSVQVSDGSGQTADDSRTVQRALAGGESTETFPADGTDWSEWSLDGFALDTEEDHTGGESASLYGAAVPSEDFGLVKKTSVVVQLGDSPTLSYKRKLDINCAQLTCNALSPAAFRVKVQRADQPLSLKEVVDSVNITESGSTYLEDVWTESTVDLSDYSGQVVKLFFYVGAHYYSHARVWIDDIAVTGGEFCAIQPPQISVEAAGESDCCMTLEGSVSDPGGADIVLVYLDVAGEISYLTPSANGSWSHTQCDLGKGQHAAQATAVNQMGAQAQAETTFTVSDCAGATPVLTIGSVTTAGDCVVISGTAIDPDGEVPVLSVDIDGGAQTLVDVDAAGSWTFEACQIAAGEHQARFTAEDGTGLRVLEAVDFSIEEGTSSDVDPVVSISEVTTRLDCANVKGTVEPLSPGLQMSARLDKGSFRPIDLFGDGRWIWDQCLIPAGDHTVTIRAVTRSEKSGELAREFEIAVDDDTVVGPTMPKVAIQEMVTTDNCVRLTGTARASTSGELSVTITLNQMNSVDLALTAEGHWTYSWCGGAGDYTAAIRAVDGAGNFDEATSDFTLGGSACSTTGTSSASWFLGLVGILLLIRPRRTS